MWEKDPLHPKTPSRTSTPQHRQWRLLVLDRDQYQCQLRYPGRCIGTATEADHIIEYSRGGSEFDPNNGQAACTPCHAHKTALDANQQRWANRAHYDEGTHPGLR